MGFARGPLADVHPFCSPQPPLLGQQYADASIERLTWRNSTPPTQPRRNWRLCTPRSRRAGLQTQMRLASVLRSCTIAGATELSTRARAGPEPPAFEAVIGLQLREARLDILEGLKHSHALRRARGRRSGSSVGA